jgi:ABC-type transport system involved in multi-copper enzyme maturation permease subunit
MIRKWADPLLTAGPILHRELRELLRSPRAFWMAALTVAGTSLIPLLAWPEGDGIFPPSHAREAFEEYRLVFGVAIYLFVSPIAASAITTEREQGTYELLLSAPIAEWGLFLGKVLSSVAFSLALIFMTFPVALLLFLLGGFEPEEFLAALGLLLLGGLCAGMVGVWASEVSATTPRAIFKAYLSLLPFLLGTFLEHSIFFLWVIALTMVVVIAGRTGGRSIGNLPQGEARRAPPAPPLSPSRSRPDPTLSYGRELARKLFPSLERGLPDGQNPVLLAHVRNESAKTELVQNLLFLGFALSIPGALALAASGKPGTGLLAGGEAALILAALLHPVLASRLLSMEREKGTLDLLRATPLSGRVIIGGKLGAALFTGSRILFYAALACALLLPFLYGKELELLILPIWLLLSLVAVSILGAAAGLLASTLCRTTVQAVVLAYGFLATLHLTTPLSPLTALTIRIYQLEHQRTEDVAAELVLSPFSALLVAYLLFTLAVRIFEKRWMRDH